MRVVDIIIKKREGAELSKAEIDFFVEGFVDGSITDYQASAWAMAVLLKGMSPQETTDLTLAMARSGEVLDLSQIAPMVVDKHSTGGVGDKTSLVVEPMVAACGLPVGKMSGRGLGFSGGTIDKLESLPGYRTDLSTKEFLRQLKTVGLVLTGQSVDLAPADGKLYALRDVTGTVESTALIASSIMSKKIASGANAIVLDVKVGVGAFMKDLARAKELARLMVQIAKLSGMKAEALLADMNQPLGQAVGNALEVKEAIATLNGQGPEDFKAHCVTIAGSMLALGGMAKDQKYGEALARKMVANKAGLAKFKELVKAQGGDVRVIDDPDKLPKAPLIKTVMAAESGYLKSINAMTIGMASVALGAGRAKKTDSIDHAVGFEILHKVGDKVAEGEPLFVVHARKKTDFETARKTLLEAHVFSSQKVKKLPLFYGTIK